MAAKIYRFTVPENDTEVIQWLAEQEKVSISLRLLIKQYIATHGPGDMITSFGSIPEQKRKVTNVVKEPEKTEDKTPEVRPAPTGTSSMLDSLMN